MVEEGRSRAFRKHGEARALGPGELDGGGRAGQSGLGQRGEFAESRASALRSVSKMLGQTEGEACKFENPRASLFVTLKNAEEANLKIRQHRPLGEC